MQSWNFVATNLAERKPFHRVACQLPTFVTWSTMRGQILSRFPKFWLDDCNRSRRARMNRGEGGVFQFFFSRAWTCSGGGWTRLTAPASTRRRLKLTIFELLLLNSFLATYIFHHEGRVTALPGKLPPFAKLSMHRIVEIRALVKNSFIILGRCESHFWEEKVLFGVFGKV